MVCRGSSRCILSYDQEIFGNFICDPVMSPHKMCYLVMRGFIIIDLYFVRKLMVQYDHYGHKIKTIMEF